MNICGVRFFEVPLSPSLMTPSFRAQRGVPGTRRPQEAGESLDCDGDTRALVLALPYAGRPFPALSIRFLICKMKELGQTRSL